MSKRSHTETRDHAPLSVGDVVDVEVERLVPGGAGLAHAGGRTLFVALAAPGDDVRVRIQQWRGGFAFAEIAEIITPAPARIEPPCPYFGRCGGCDFQQLTYPAQLAAKGEIIPDCLRRIARPPPPTGGTRRRGARNYGVEGKPPGTPPPPPPPAKDQHAPPPQLWAGSRGGE